MTNQQQPRKKRKASAFTVRFPELVSAIHFDSDFANSATGQKLIVGVMKAQTAK